MVPVGPGRPDQGTSLAFPVGEPTLNEFPIHRHKVQRPSLRDQTLRRDRLLDSVRVKIHHRIVQVVAEAGYGKTTLLADFSRRSRIRSMWYRLDDDDRNWISVLNYLVAAGREIDPGFAPTTLAMLREMETGGPSLEAALETFLHELPAVIDGATVLIFDDYHLVDDVADVRTIVRAIANRGPERLTLILISRRQPGLGLARLRGQGEIVELTTDDLRFDRNETERLFSEVYGRPLEADVVSDLQHRTEGWAASLQLVEAAVRNRSGGEVRRFIRGLNGAQGALYDYLAEEVVGRLDAEVQEFLMRTAMLEAIEPDLAAVATGCTPYETVNLLEAVESTGLLSGTGEGPRDTLRYHPLVRDFLLARLHQELGDNGVRELHRSVARYGETRSWRTAAHHYGQAGDAADVHRVLVGATARIMGTGEFAVAESFIRQFPFAEPAPWFEIVLSRRDLHHGRVESALVRARAAFDLFAPDDHSADANLALANLMSVAYHVGDLEESIRIASALDGRHPEPNLAQITRVMLEVTRTSIDGSLDRACWALEEAAALQRRSGYLHYYGVTMLNLACVDRVRGDAELAVQHASDALECLTETSAGLELGSALTVRAWGLAHLGRWTEAVSQINEALALPHRLTRIETLSEAADIYSAYGDPIIAESLLREAEMDLRAGHHVDHSLWLANAGWTLARIGRLEEAARFAEHQADGPSSDVANRSRMLTLRAYLQVLAGDPQRFASLDSSDDLSRRQGATSTALVTSIARAASSGGPALSELLTRLKPSDHALVSATANLIAPLVGDLSGSALELVRAEAQGRPVRWRPLLRGIIASEGSPRTVGASAELLDMIGETQDIGLLRGLVRQTRGRVGPPHVGKTLAKRLANHVFVEDLGRVAITVGSQHLAGTDVRRKVLALLCFLISRPEMASTRDQALDALWPDTEPDVAANSLNQTIYFLRRVFEPEFQDDVSPGYIHHDSDILWLDTDLIDSRSATCQRLLVKMGRPPTPGQVERLATEYRARFALDFAYEEWAGPFREGLHARYLEVLEREISSDTAGGHFDRAIRLAQLATAADPEAEHLELALLRLYRTTGAHSAAAEQYAHYATMMRNDLGIEPPPLDTL